MKVKVSELKAGERFTSAGGEHYVASGREHAGAVFARPRAIYEKDPEGDETCFAACADVERGWLAEGWSDRERRERG